MPSTQYSIYIKAVKIIGVTHGILEGNNSDIATVETLFTRTVATAQGTHSYTFTCLQHYKPANYIYRHIILVYKTTDSE